MKLKTFAATFALAALLTITSCNNGGKNTTDSAAVAELSADAAAETSDTVCCDSIAPVTRGGEPSEGFGRCLKSGCNCKEFEGRGETCRNCGHAYKRHY